ncbi:metal ABC transporter solute-binding protein, Zn/Mn family [Candidatus Borrarchaeum sp.]|uniref:metal ABC transporter solute-binding protein, Zn/Mn family n=1 Tax=Candidatus Borrarchaeum sp. TaxID=2846742 RepID=UPI00257FE2A1|nr:zinc ABC transporter substrate-binding protein [Candidatus Borrarchaeum sp.]
MNKRIQGLIAAVIVVICLVGAYSYISPQITETSEGKIGVVVTIVPQTEFVESVAGDRVTVTVMVPSGASPHTYEPTPSQLEAVSKAQIYFKVGSGVEFETAWWDKIIAANPNIYVIDSSEGIELIGTDPHIWNSPINAKKMVENFYNGLTQVDPDHKDEYKANKDIYLQQLDELDNYIRELFVDFTNRVFLIYHPSFGYFAEEYGLTQIAIEHGGKEPTPQVIQESIDAANTYNLSYVYVAPQFSTIHAKTIANEIGGKILYIDPLAENYIDNMSNVADALALEFE